MTVLRGVRALPRRAWLTAGCLAVLLLLAGVQPATAGPPDHARGAPSGEVSASSTSSTQGASHTPGKSDRGRTRPSRSVADSRPPAHANAPSARTQSPSSGPPGRTDSSSPPAHAAASGRPAHAGPSSGAPSPGPTSDAPATGPPPHAEAADQAREQPADPAREQPGDEDEGGPEQAAHATFEPANGDDAPFAAPAPATATGPALGVVPASGQPPVDLEQPTGIAQPDPAATDDAPPAETHLVDPAAGGSPQAADRVLSPGRDFGVPALLLATLLGYLAVQRRLDRGSLPMMGLASAPDENHDDVRFEL